MLSLVLTNDPHEFSPSLPSARMEALPAGYAAWTTDPEKAGAHLTDDVRARIEKIQPIKVRVDEERVRIFCVGICPPLTRIHEAMKLAAALARGGHAAPYR